MPLAIDKLTEHIGAEVQGVELAATIDAATFAQLRSAFYQHAVLVFRDQKITAAQQVAFSAGFGPLEMTIPSDPIGDGGPVGILSNVDEKGQIFPPDDPRMLYYKGNSLWHSDGSFKQVPLRGSLLAAKVVPPTGGETEYASLRAAYNTLPEKKKAALEGLLAEHSLAHSRQQISPNLVSEAFLKDTPPVENPSCAPSLQRAKRYSWSAPIPPALSTGRSQPARLCWTSCWIGQRNRNSSTATPGRPTTWSCGIIACVCTGQGPLTARTTSALCTAPPLPATRAESTPQNLAGK